MTRKMPVPTTAFDPADDAAIVREVTGGNAEAYGILMERYEARLIRYVSYLIHADPDSAADIVQETFIKAYQNLRGFDSAYKFSSWIYRIAHNEAMNVVRKDRHLVHDADLEPVALSEAEEDIAGDMDHAILRDDVAGCLHALEPKYREVLMLQYYEHMKYAEIADVLHIPAATVGVWVSRAKAKMQALCRQKGVQS